MTRLAIIAFVFVSIFSGTVAIAAEVQRPSPQPSCYVKCLLSNVRETTCVFICTD